MLILLDIDGVMLPANPWKRPEFLEDNFFAFNHRSVKALQKITEKIPVDIVLTTSHKNAFSLEKWADIFTRRGIAFNTIDRLPENRDHFSRKEEIMHWIENTSIEKEFIIIDDDKSLNGLPDYLKSRLIQTSATVGLTEELVEEALHYLEETLV